jgi:hypothetical protein
MISLRDIYRAEGARPEPYPGAFGSDRGFAQGMEQAHLLIIQDPDDWLAGSMND